MTPGREVSGYVLAGGRSSRMGREKALLQLGGKPLIEHAVAKLRRVCEQVAILSSNPLLAAYAPLVADVHPGCGPMGGIETALMHAVTEWSLFLPVDVPFLPTAYLKRWIEELAHTDERGVRVWIFTVEGRAQPTVALLHREVRPFLTTALEAGEYKLLPAMERAAAELASRRGSPLVSGLMKTPAWQELESKGGEETMGDRWQSTTPQQQQISERWFANLNTPEEFAEAERHVDALDT